MACSVMVPHTQDTLRSQLPCRASAIIRILGSEQPVILLSKTTVVSAARSKGALSKWQAQP